MQGLGFPKHFIGSGPSFPFEFSQAQGGQTGTQTSLSISDGVSRIRQSLLQILYTFAGERPMRRGFGSNFSSFLFEPLDKQTLNAIIYEGQTAIQTWEPRVTVVRFQIGLIDQSNGLLQISVDFKIKDTNEAGNLVFPFYLNEGQIPRALVTGGTFQSVKEVQ